MAEKKRKIHPNSKPLYLPSKIARWAREQSSIGRLNNWKVGGGHSWSQNK